MVSRRVAALAQRRSKAGLDSLIAAGWLNSRKLSQSDEIYSVKKEKLAEIEIYLRRTIGGAKPGTVSNRSRRIAKGGLNAGGN